MGNFAEAEATIGHGKKLEWSATENGTYARIGGTVTISLPEAELGTAEITNDQSTDRRKDYIPGLYEPGTLGFSYVYGATEFAEVEELFQEASTAAGAATATKYWKYTLPDGSVAKFRGFITKHGLGDGAQEDAYTVEGEMQVRGAMTFTPPA